jgi:hypothetical protein
LRPHHRDDCNGWDTRADVAGLRRTDNDNTEDSTLQWVTSTTSRSSGGSCSGLSSLLCSGWLWRFSITGPISRLTPVTTPKKKTTAKAFLIPDGKLFRLDQMEALPNPPVAAAVRRILAFLASYGDGYRRPALDQTQLHSGHSVALFLFFGYLGLYVGLMGITAPRPLPVVEHITQAITIVILFIAALN